jgi:hypothetical protein
MSNVPEHADTARGPHFELWHLGSGSVIHTYPTEASALAFVRDVLVVAGHDAASKFRLTFSDARGRTTTIAEGTDLVRRVLEDRVL